MELMLQPMNEEILASLFRAFADERVRYALFGGLAVAACGLSRATKDVDLFLDGDPENVRAAVRALETVFQDPDLRAITPDELASYGLVRYGVRDYDFVIDLTQRIGEVFTFQDLDTAEIDFLGVRVPVVTPRTLIRMKRETGRPQDQLDVARLRERFGIEDL
jgi:hypothetical protein